jgi:hypothetical protein
MSRKHRNNQLRFVRLFHWEMDVLNDEAVS